MAVDPFGTAELGATVFSSAALVLSQQARQGVSEQVEQIAQKSQKSDQYQIQLESAKADTQPQQNQAAVSPSSQSEPSRGQIKNIIV